MVWFFDGKTRHTKSQKWNVIRQNTKGKKKKKETAKFSVNIKLVHPLTHTAAELAWNGEKCSWINIYSKYRPSAKCIFRCVNRQAPGATTKSSFQGYDLSHKRIFTQSLQISSRTGNEVKKSFAQHRRSVNLFFAVAISNWHLIYAVFFLQDLPV